MYILASIRASVVKWSAEIDIAAEDRPEKERSGERE
jgi:hypothetical protein